MKQKRELSVGKQCFLWQTVTGILLCMNGILEFFPCIVCRILQLLFLLGAIGTEIFVMRAKKESTDEMADEHYLRAKVKAYAVMLIFLFGGITFLYVMKFIPESDNWNWVGITSGFLCILIGIASITIGITFKKLEEQ